MAVTLLIMIRIIKLQYNMREEHGIIKLRNISVGKLNESRILRMAKINNIKLVKVDLHHRNNKKK